MSAETTTASTIRLRGARQNNLKGVDLDLPLGKLIVVTGLSGAGKSSLVFETLHAEGQRRYVETFSPYTRQFMEMLDRPKVDSIENIRPSIAIEQRNTVKTSRSTVGTMTELCDFFKVWFAHVATLFDPDTGLAVEDDNPESIWKKVSARFNGRTVLLAFAVRRVGKLAWKDILKPLAAQGYTRAVVGAGSGNQRGIVRIDEIDTSDLTADAVLHVVQDRIAVQARARGRFLDAARTALHFGQGRLELLAEDGAPLARYSEGLHSPETDRSFRAATPNLFSFNSPLGACPKCRGFGRVIEVDYRLVIPDESLSLADGAIRAFSGKVYSESLRDLMRACAQAGVRTGVPWRELDERERAFVIEGDPEYERKKDRHPHPWYGVRRFFDWLEGTTYKMHVRVFLSKYRAYTHCPQCDGKRLQPEALFWKWQGHTLPELYRLPISRLVALLRAHAPSTDGASAGTDRRVSIALQSILTRLNYLEQSGLGYLTLDRSSRTLSGGETQRVNLTSCLGTSLVDTLFILDEPSIGLHARDIDRLVRILRRLTDLGNTVVVVEHDESIMRAADHIVEVGPKPGAEGGRIVFSGPFEHILSAPDSITGQYLSGSRTIDAPGARRKVGTKTRWLHMRGITKHNLRELDVSIPLGRFVVLSGVSGSGKSTLLDNVIHQGMLARAGAAVEDPAVIREIECDSGFAEIVLVDQSPITRTPRSNPALFVDLWDTVRQLFTWGGLGGPEDKRISDFSFNTGTGRCPHCQGLGYERIEMQFMADVFVQCPICEGKRFRPEILEVTFRGLNVAQVLDLSVDDARAYFTGMPEELACLEALRAVGLGYLSLGQPLNTLSGGESQRLKLVKYLTRVKDSVDNALILIDEPTTGLHRDDVARLLPVLQQLVDRGHSLVVIEHNLDVLKSADWLIELGPDAGENGGRVVFAGTPAQLARGKSASSTATAPFIAEALGKRAAKRVARGPAASAAPAVSAAPEGVLRVTGAREHNLRNLSVDIEHNTLTVVTGVSGSGKSSLAFDIVFAEGQRRFMESMSSWARQFVEQMPRPDVDEITGIPPTVAIEQRVTHGTRKSTVATITEVAQYLRLLYARVGVPHSRVTGEPLVALPRPTLVRLLTDAARAHLKSGHALLHLFAPLVRGRKGHHQPLQVWAEEHGYALMRIDGAITPVSEFRKLDRFREHDVEVGIVSITLPNKRTGKLEARLGKQQVALEQALDDALRIGRGACMLADAQGKVLRWFSITRTDPATGEAFPDLDPKHFSWNSARGWCDTCFGHGSLHDWMRTDERFTALPKRFADGDTCPTCDGQRLNPLALSVYIHLKDGRKLNLPQLLQLEPDALLAALHALELDARGRAIAAELIPEVTERLRFMGTVGLKYLSLDRATNTLSGGEAQRIRLAAQLGSNLSGVLYVLDEPSIGLHARDNARLIESLQKLRHKGNTLLVVEHDAETMRAADHIIDLGPGAGIHGGRLLAGGTLDDLLGNPESLTGKCLLHGMPHPSRGAYRPLPRPWSPRARKHRDDWLVLDDPRLRNLKGGCLTLPLNRLNVVCGISGAGKSTLIRDLLHPAVERAIALNATTLDGTDAALPFKRLVNGNAFRAVIEVDQSPIGKTPRSTPATYNGAFDIIRQFFGNLPDARLRGFNPGSFSFNTKGGRCESCKGAGRIKLEMSFMPDTYIDCDDCQGRRYQSDLLEVLWNNKSISDVLDMSFEEAAAFFSFHDRLHGILDLMVQTGLGYLRLGQTSPTLSGGEAQRLKLVSELAKGLPTATDRARGTAARNLYILEEPTIGLHMSDCQRLVQLLHRLVDQGHTIIVIEHNTDLIAEADYVVEIGPEGGAAGGHIICQGTLDVIRACKRSATAPFLP